MKHLFTKFQIKDHKNYYNHDTGTKLGHLIVVFNKNIHFLLILLFLNILGMVYFR